MIITDLSTYKSKSYVLSYHCFFTERDFIALRDACASDDHEEGYVVCVLLSITFKYSLISTNLSVIWI